MDSNLQQAAARPEAATEILLGYLDPMNTGMKRRASVVLD
jgi:hypothetical protein